MRQWEVYEFPHPGENDPHPCVIISPEAILANPGYEGVNVIPCQTLYAGRAAKPAEVLLDEADSLERLSVAKCQYVFYYPKSQRGRRYGAGRVSPVRQREIKIKLVKLFGLYVS